MFRTTLKSLLAHKIRLFATSTAVMLGVAFMAGTLVLTDTVTTTFNGVFASVYKGFDAVVREKAAFEGPNNSGAQRGRVPASLVDQLSHVPGVKTAEGGVFGYARLVGKDGRAIGNPAAGAPTLGMAWSDVPELNPMKLVEGRPPRTDNEIVIDKKSAKDGNLAIGDSTTVLVQGPPQRVTVVGIVRFGNADSPAGASVAMFTAASAQRWVAEPGKFDSISFVAQPGVSQTALVRNLSTALPAGTEAITGHQLIKESQDTMAKAMAFFRTFMLIFAVVALLVGGFMIFNTFSITVAQRTRENGLLRALGASKRQVLVSVFLEALTVGVVASLVGLALGVLVAVGLKGLLAVMGFGSLPAGGITFQSRTVVVCLVAGIGVTLVAALSPARKAAKVHPVTAMQEGTVTSTGYGSKERVFVGIGVLAAGAAALFTGLFAHVQSPVTVVGLGAMLVFFGVAILGRTLSLPLSRIIGSPLPALRGVTGTLARENAMRNPKRTAATASALMICVGVVGFMTIFASSARASINHVVNEAFTGDFIIDSGTSGMFGGLDPSLTARLNQTPGIQSAAGIRMGSVKIDNSVAMIAAVDPATAFQVWDPKILQGSPSDLGADAIAVYKNTASDKHLKIGDHVPVLFKDTGEKSLRVAMIYGSNQPAGNYFLGIKAYEANFTNQFDFQVFVKKAAGTSTATALATVKSVAATYPGSKVMDQSQYKAAMAKPFNQLLGLVYVLLLLAVIIALLGIGNTLALSIFERTRELGLLRAVGMTRKQLKATIRWESVVIALQGSALGLLIGIFFGWALVTAMKDQGTTVFSIPYGILVVIALLAGVAGVIAAIWPGRRAAKLDVLRAVVTD